MSKRLTTSEFITKSQSIHGDLYDYSQVEYINAHTKVCIICPEHGEFWQISNGHLSGYGCDKCARTKSGLSKQSNTCDFVTKSIQVHGDKYDYSKVEYINNRTNVCIICPIHGDFQQIPNSHLSGQGCQECGSIKRELSKQSNTPDFIQKSIDTHGDKYNYSKVEYINSYTKVCIICPIHGEFWQRTGHHINGHGCPICNESHGERDTVKWLDDNNVKYIRQQQFDGLVGVSGWCKLLFDFYLPDSNTCIEYDGIQHYMWCEGMMTYQGFLELQEHDRRKNKYCDDNNIKLIRIRYDDDIDNSLINIINNGIIT